jgi:3-oxoacyl-[acyl-carrier protein] reductase
MMASAIPPLAVVTGAAAGIGRAAVDLLVRDGWTVIALDSNGDQLREVRAEHGPTKDVRPVTADLRDPADAIAAIEKVVESGRRIGALLNIAGISGKTTPDDFDLEVAEDILRVNLLAPQALSFAFWDRFAPDACIVNAGSVLVSYFREGAATYSASKAGLAALSFYMQQTAGDSGLRVYCINFGLVETRMTEGLILQAPSPPRLTPEQAAEEILACVKARRRGMEGLMYPLSAHRSE